MRRGAAQRGTVRCGAVRRRGVRCGVVRYCAFSAQVQKECNRDIRRKIKNHNLDLVISAAFRVNSKRGVEFRIRANKTVIDCQIKGIP